jgi:hypothetical protein
MYKTANPDQEWAIISKGVRRGEYKAYAWEDIEPGGESCVRLKPPKACPAQSRRKARWAL